MTTDRSEQSIATEAALHAIDERLGLLAPACFVEPAYSQSEKRIVIKHRTCRKNGGSVFPSSSSASNLSPPMRTLTLPRFVATLFCLSVLVPALPQATGLQKLLNRPDESGVLHTADTYHILVPNQVTATDLLREILAAPPTARLEKFKDVARRASKDPGSAPAGGELGTVREGEMVRSFEAAVFAAKPGEVTGPFKSEFGWHLVYVTRNSEQPVADICRRAIDHSLASATKSDVAGLSLASSPPDRHKLPQQIEPLLGVGWTGPLMDQGRNLLYLRADTRPRQNSQPFQVVTRHTELTTAQLVSTASPMGCVRSVREQWAVDCSGKTTGFLSLYEFEGRAAAGRRLTSVNEDAAKTKFQPVQPGTLGAELFDFACKQPSAQRKTS